jgi:soluble lytic murein transglycosylase-like protein
MKLLLTFLVLSASSSTLACYKDSNILPWIDYYAAELHLDSDLVHAVISAESSYCLDATSKTGAYGIMQLMPYTARSLGVDRYDPLQNLYGGMLYLAQNYERFGDWTLALAAYNAGPSAVIKYGGVPPYHETRNYIIRIHTTYVARKGP